MIWLLYVNGRFSFYSEQLTNNCYLRSTNKFLWNLFRLKPTCKNREYRGFRTLQNKLMIHSFVLCVKMLFFSKLLRLNVCQMAKRKVKQVENGKMFYHRNYFCRRYVQDVRKKRKLQIVVCCIGKGNKSDSACLPD